MLLVLSQKKKTLINEYTVSMGHTSLTLGECIYTVDESYVGHRCCVVNFVLLFPFRRSLLHSVLKWSFSNMGLTFSLLVGIIVLAVLVLISTMAG